MKSTPMTLEQQRDALLLALQSLIKYEGTTDETGIGEMPSENLLDALRVGNATVEAVQLSMNAPQGDTMNLFSRHEPSFKDTLPQLAPGMTRLLVSVRAERDTRQLHSEDREVAGTYMVDVPEDLPEGLQAGLALDQLHERVAIKMPEDFSIEVLKTIESDPDYEKGIIEQVGVYRGALRG